MKPGEDNQSVTVPPALLAEIQEAAKAERRTPDELVREAVERYLENRRWQRLLTYGEKKARSMGVSETEIPRLIAEYRQEKRSRHS